MALTIQGIYTTIIFIIVVYFLEKHIIRTLELGKSVIKENEKLMINRKLIEKPFRVILNNKRKAKKKHYYGLG